jgi:uncharacterized membrane protein
MTAATAATLRGIRIATAVTVCALALLCLGWELWLAPLRPGGSWLALKVLPLLWMAPGIFRGRAYSYRAMTLLILAYFAEGAVRAYTEAGLSGWLAAVEIALALAVFTLAIAYVRTERSLRSATAEAR